MILNYASQRDYDAMTGKRGAESAWSAEGFGAMGALRCSAYHQRASPGPVGPYQIQAAIAAIHDQAPSAEKTDWPQIVALYELLLKIADNPIVALNHAVAVGMARGAQGGLDLLDTLRTDRRIAGDHRFHAVHAHLLEMAGDHAGAHDAYLAAAERATDLPQQRHLYARAARLAHDP